MDFLNFIVSDGQMLVRMLEIMGIIGVLWCL